MKIGALSVDAPREDVDKFEKLGEALGICFQLRDDIFDYFSDNVGKPTGNDIREGKVTLPLLFALKNADSVVSDSMKSIIEKALFSDQEVDTLINFAKDNGGIDYAYNKIDFHKKIAIDIIDTLEAGDIKDSLLHTVDYVVERVY